MITIKPGSYRVIEARSSTQLDEKVNEFLKGCMGVPVLIGGPKVAVDTQNIIEWRYQGVGERLEERKKGGDWS